MTDEWRAETDKIHTRINEVKGDVGELKGDIRVIGAKLANIHDDIKEGQAMRVVDRRGWFTIIAAAIASFTALVRSFWQ